MLTELHVIQNILTYKGQCNNINGKTCIVKVWEVTLQKANILKLTVHGQLLWPLITQRWLNQQVCQHVTGMVWNEMDKEKWNDVMLAHLTRWKKSKGIQYGKYMSQADYQDQMLSYHLCEREKLLLHKKSHKYGTSSVECKCNCRYSGAKSITDIQHFLFLNTSPTKKPNSPRAIYRLSTKYKAI
jgi:hypothetical protein